jgi:hypothetical protein
MGDTQLTRRPMHALGALRALTGALRGDASALPTSDADWDAFFTLAAAHDLLPAVWSAQWHAGRLTVSAAVAEVLEREAPTGRAVPEVVLRRAHDRNAARVARLLDRGVDILHRLADAGIRAVPLKGLHSLLAGTWADPAARTMADLDVLVGRDHAPRAYALLQAAGYTEHPDPIGEHADHHLPMLRAGDVTVELHVEPLVSRWRALVPAPQMLRRAMYRPTTRGVMLLADDTDAFVHLVAHAQLQEETYRLLGLPLRALLETSLLDPRPVDWKDVRARFARGGVGHVLDAHLDATRHGFGATSLPEPSPAGARRARAHTRLAELVTAVPELAGAWTYAVRVPRSFSVARMHDEFGSGDGAAWLWQARARHAARRVGARLARHDHPRAQ